MESITILKNAILVLSRHQAGLLQMTPAVQESIGAALRWVALKHKEQLELGIEGVKLNSIEQRRPSSPALLSLVAKGLSGSHRQATSASAAMADTVMKLLRG